MNTSALKQGQKLEVIWTPLNAGGEQAGGWVGHRNVVEIEISQCAGPMKPGTYFAGPDLRIAALEEQNAALAARAKLEERG